MVQSPMTEDAALEVSVLDSQLTEMIEIISEIDEPRDLCECAYSALESILRREDDAELLVSLSESIGEIIGNLPFETAPKDLEKEVRNAARACIAVLKSAQESRIARLTPVAAPDSEEPAVESEEFYYLPPKLEHLLKRLDYVSPEPLAAEKRLHQLPGTL